MVLSRKKLESLVINDSIVVKVLRVKGNPIVIGIDAPREISVRRAELGPQVDVSLDSRQLVA